MFYSHAVKEKRLKYREKCLVLFGIGCKYNNINLKVLSIGDISEEEKVKVDSNAHLLCPYVAGMKTQ